MAPRCGCGSSSACNCLVTAGANVTVTGTGSSGNPYVITSTASGAPPAPMLMAALLALQAGSALVPGQTYTVTDWTIATVPGPNTLTFTAAAVNKLNSEVQIKTPFGNDLGPNKGIWNFTIAQMVYLEDGIGNRVWDLGTGALAQFPWGDINCRDNVLTETTLTGLVAALTAGIQFTGNMLSTVTLDLSGVTGGIFSHNAITDSAVDCSLAGQLVIIQHCNLTASSSLVTGINTIADGLVMDSSSITVTPTAGNVSIQESSFSRSGLWTIGNPVGFDMQTCRVSDTSSIYSDAGATRGIEFRSCDIANSIIDRTGAAAGADTDVVINCSILGCNLTWTVTVDPGTLQTVSNSRFFDTVISFVDMNSNLPVTACETCCFSTLNVQAGGAVHYCSLRASSTFNTGANIQIAVVVEFQGITTATVANTNKRRDSLGSNVV